MPQVKQGSRRKARKKAFQCLYSLDFQKDAGPGSIASSFTHFFEDETVPLKEKEFAMELLRGVLENSEEINRLIGSYSRHWRLERIAKIELGILRLAIYEMVYRPDIPLKVSINEAVELSKMFGDENSKGFINGILDAVAQSVRKGELGTRKEA